MFRGSEGSGVQRVDSLPLITLIFTEIIFFERPRMLIWAQVVYVVVNKSAASLLFALPPSL
jgi:hypothetical protein